jgi:LDH2 family malate/lactate/ureidoglycolate dehydrogenase
MTVLPSHELAAFVREIYVTHGVSDREAEVVSRHQVNSNLVGHDSHGVIMTKSYVKAVHAGQVVPGAEFQLERETPSTAVINANWGFGFVMTEQAMDLAIEKAGNVGTAALTIRFQGHIGRLGAYAARAAERGFAAMIMADSGRGPKSVAPFGGRTALLGTNPLCFAVPSARHGAVVLDMATSAVALGKVRLAQARGVTLPPGWIIDGAGAPSTDPQDIDRGGALLPLGGDQGHKGYGLSFIVETFCGLLTGLGYGVAADGRHNDGNFIAVHDIGCFMDPTEFASQVSDFIDYLKTGAAEGSEVLFPGELEQRTARTRERDGIFIEDATWADLQALAASA